MATVDLSKGNHNYVVFADVFADMFATMCSYVAFHKVQNFSLTL